MKKFLAIFKSESGDSYKITFEAPRTPQTPEEWRKVLVDCESIPEEDVSLGEGPGIAGSYLHLTTLEEL